MSSATAATVKAPRATKKSVKNESEVVVAVASSLEDVTVAAAPDFGSDEETPNVSVAEPSAGGKKRGRKAKSAAAAASSSEDEAAAEAAAPVISSVADALSRFSALENDLQLLVDYLRKSKPTFSKSEVTDLTRHHKKTNELHSKLSDSVVSTITHGSVSAATAASGEKTKKGFKKDGTPRKKAEHKSVDIHPVLQTYMESHKLIDVLIAKDPEFASSYAERAEKKLTRPEVQQLFSHIIAEMKREHPEETKSTMMRTKTEKDGSTVEVVDNTYYRVFGPKVTRFLRETSDIIKAEIAKGESSKYKDNIATLRSGMMIDADGNIPALISQKWHMSYINFFILRE
jgi:hypothetical protein